MAAEPHQHDQRRSKVIVQGADAEGHPFSFLKEVSCSDRCVVHVYTAVLTLPLPTLQVHITVLGRVHPLLKEPFVCPVEWREKEQAEVVVKVVFHSHYGEPPVDQRLAIRKGKGEVVALLKPHPQL